MPFITFLSPAVTHKIRSSLKSFILSLALLNSTSIYAEEKASEECAKPECEIKIDLEEIYRHRVTNTDFDLLEVPEDFYQSPYKVSLFNAQNGEDSARLWSQSKAIFALGFSVIGVISLLPEDVSNWERGEIFGKWDENVKAGPVWDRDGVGINVVGHGYFGGVYYQVARKSGYRQWDAFLYSVIGSSFYWEYGIEAFAEVPSIQDLVLTPIIGWAYGEWAYQTEQSILAGGGDVWGSDTLGSVSLFLLDPIDSASVGINNLFGHEVFVAGSGYLDFKDVPVGHNGEKDSLVQLGVSYQFGSGKKYNKTRIHRGTANHYKDPITSSIIGISYGIGQFNFDEKWQLKNDTYDEMSIALYFSKKLSGRLAYAKTNVIDATTNKTVRIENYNLSAQYYFNTEHKFRPFVMAGFGEMMRDESIEKKTFQTHLGLGAHYQITSNFALQTDVRAFHSASSETVESTYSATLIYRIGKGEY